MITSTFVAFTTHLCLQLADASASPYTPAQEVKIRADRLEIPTLVSEHRYEEALALSAQLTKTYPSSAAVHADHANLIIAFLADLESAQQELLRAVQLSPNDPDTLALLGTTQTALDLDREGIASLQRAFTLEPNHPMASRELHFAQTRFRLTTEAPVRPAHQPAAEFVFDCLNTFKTQSLSAAVKNCISPEFLRPYFEQHHITPEREAAFTGELLRVLDAEKDNPFALRLTGFSVAPLMPSQTDSPFIVQATVATFWRNNPDHFQTRLAAIDSPDGPSIFDPHRLEILRALTPQHREMYIRNHLARPVRELYDLTLHVVQSPSGLRIVSIDVLDANQEPINLLEDLPEPQALTAAQPQFSTVVVDPRTPPSTVFAIAKIVGLAALLITAFFVVKRYAKR